jgi:hypothetical protein
MFSVTLSCEASITNDRITISYSLGKSGLIVFQPTEKQTDVKAE